MSELPSFLAQTGPAAYTLTLSASGAYDMDLCEALFSWRRVTAIEAATARAGRNYGKAVHLLLQAHHDPARKPFVAADIVNNWFAKNPQPALTSQQKPEWRTAARALQAFEAYKANYPAEDFEVLGVEEKFDVTLGTFETTLRDELGDDIVVEVTVRFHGLLDLPVKWHDQLWILDTKYSTEWGDLKVDEGKSSFQFMGYTWAKRALQKEAIIKHALQIVGSSPAKDASILPVAGVYGNYVISREPYAEGHKATKRDRPRDQFVRQDYHYSDAELAEWHHEAMGIAQEIWDCWRTEEWPRRRPACAHWGRCEFYALCWETEPAYRLAAAMGADYRPRTPSPFEDESNGKRE